jgi:hypothetical protein
MIVSTVTPPASATSPFLAGASWVQRLPSALIRLATQGFRLNCRFLNSENRLKGHKNRYFYVATRKTGVASRPQAIAGGKWPSQLVRNASQVGK